MSDQLEGPREALKRYLEADYKPVKLSQEDHLLAWLWQEGFRIVPHEELEDQYRMGQAFERAKLILDRRQ